MSGIRTHDPSVRESEDNSCLRPHGHCDQRFSLLPIEIKQNDGRVLLLVFFGHCNY
jgi:hypothetical protein